MLGGVNGHRSGQRLRRDRAAWREHDPRHPATHALFGQPLAAADGGGSRWQTGLDKSSLEVVDYPGTELAADYTVQYLA